MLLVLKYFVICLLYHFQYFYWAATFALPEMASDSQMLLVLKIFCSLPIVKLPKYFTGATHFFTSYGLRTGVFRMDRTSSIYLCKLIFELLSEMRGGWFGLYHVLY